MEPIISMYESDFNPITDKVKTGLTVELEKDIGQKIFPKISRVFATVVGKNIDGFVLVTVFGYIGPLSEKDFKFVNYHLNAESETLH